MHPHVFWNKQNILVVLLSSNVETRALGLGCNMDLRIVTRSSWLPGPSSAFKSQPHFKAWYNDVDAHTPGWQNSTGSINRKENCIYTIQSGRCATNTSVLPAASSSDLIPPWQSRFSPRKWCSSSSCGSRSEATFGPRKSQASTTYPW